MALERDRVAPLDELDDYKVADGNPDVRGWEVLGSNGQRIGKVDELLIDTVARKVRYLDVEVSDHLLNTAEDRHILIPIGYARLEDGDQIFVDGLTPSSIASIPAYAKGSITRDDETRLRTHFDREYTAGTPATTDFYAHDIYDENRFYASRSGAEQRASEMSEPERSQFGEFGRAVEGDGVSPEEDVDHVHGP